MLPKTLIPDTIRWYCLILGYCGTTRLYDTIRAQFSGINLRSMCKSYWCPDHLEQFKSTGMGYGNLPLQNANVAPWNKVCVDLIGPWKIRTGNNKYIFNALTCIDPVTNLVELIRINDKSSPHVSNQFKNCWLSRYPRCNRCVHDNGGEFIGWPFQGLLWRAGIKYVTVLLQWRTHSRTRYANKCIRLSGTSLEP